MSENIKIEIKTTEEAPFLYEGADSCISSPRKVYFSKLKQLGEFEENGAKFIIFYFERDGRKGLVLQRIKTITFDVGICTKSVHYDLVFNYFQ